MLLCIFVPPIFPAKRQIANTECSCASRNSRINRLWLKTFASSQIVPPQNPHSCCISTSLSNNAASAAHLPQPTQRWKMWEPCADRLCSHMWLRQPLPKSILSITKCPCFLLVAFELTAAKNRNDVRYLRASTSHASPGVAKLRFPDDARSKIHSYTSGTFRYLTNRT